MGDFAQRPVLGDPLRWTTTQQNHRLLGQSAATSALVAGSAWGCGAGLLQSLVPDRLNSRSARWWPSNRARGAGASEFRLLTPQRPHSFLS